MQTMKKAIAVLMLLLVVGCYAPRAFADPGETQTPPGETNAPPGEVNTPPGETNGPPAMAQGAGGLSAWLALQLLGSGWRAW